jgi:hypothetical protein
MEEFAATALVEGLPATAPVGFALVEAGGEELFVSPALAGVPGVRGIALGVLATGEPHGPEALEAGERRLLATGRPVEYGGRRMAAVLAVDITDRT